MENPEKSQNKGEGTNTAEGCGRHRAALGCRGSGRGGQGILECVLTPTDGQNREMCSPACRTGLPFGFSLFCPFCAWRTHLPVLSVCSRKHCISRIPCPPRPLPRHPSPPDGVRSLLPCSGG